MRCERDPPPKTFGVAGGHPSSSVRIVGKIEVYAAVPASQANNVTAPQGLHGIRLRVGDWRVIMHDDAVLAVLEVGPHRGIYD